MRRLWLVLGLLLIGTPVSAQWITQNGISATRFPIRLIPITQPTGTVLEGTFYYDSSAHTFKVWSGTAWVPIGNVSAVALGTTSTDGLTLGNTTPANAGTTVQISPRLKWCGTAWNSTSSVSETDCMFLEVLPSTVAGTTTATLKFGYINTAGTVTYPVTLSSVGNVIGTKFSALTGSKEFNAAADGFFDWFGRATLTSPLDGQMIVSNNAVSAGFLLDGATDGTAKLLTRAAADTAIFTTNVIRPTSPQITTASPPTGVTISDAGQVRQTLTKITVASTAFVCNATTCDVTIATLPANTRLRMVDASLTTTFACASVCTTSTLSMVLGKGAGGAEYLASFDADASTAWFGDADAELGTLMVRAAAINGGTFTSGTQAVVVRLTSGTGAVGNGAATNLSQGTVVFYLDTVVMP